MRHDTAKLIAHWQRIQQDPSLYPSETISYLVIALITRTDVPDEVIDEVFDRILGEPTGRCQDISRLGIQLYQHITNQYEDLVAKCIGLLSRRSQASHMRYIGPLLSVISSDLAADMPIVSMIWSNPQLRHTSAKSFMLATVFIELLKSPHLQCEEWQRIYRLATGFNQYTRPMNQRVKDNLIQYLAASPVADADGLLDLLWYPCAHSVIMENPNIQREFVQGAIRHLSSDISALRDDKRGFLSGQRVLSLLNAITGSPHLLEEDWRQVLSMALDFHNLCGNIQNRQSYALYLRNLVRHENADPEGLRLLWRYNGLRRWILCNPKASTDLLNDVIKRLSTGTYQPTDRRVYTQCLVENPAVTRTMLAPLLLCPDLLPIIQYKLAVLH